MEDVVNEPVESAPASVSETLSPTEPDPSSNRGKVLNELRSAGVRGISSSGAASCAGSSLRGAIGALREAGFKIDFANGHYVLSGVGKSTMRSQRPATATKPPTKRASSVKPKETGDVFVIHLDRFQKALSILPEDVRMGLMDLSRKVQNYDRIIRFYMEANQKKNRILTEKI